jgi:hypothetical protein
MLYDFQREFFLVTDDDTGEHKLFKMWRDTVEYIARKLFDWQAQVIFEEYANTAFGSGDYRAPKSYEEMFDYLYEEEHLANVNDICEGYFFLEKIEFSD